MTTATDTSKTSSTTSTFGRPAVEEASQSLRDLIEQFVESSKAAGLKTLDAYEKAVTGIADFDRQT